MEEKIKQEIEILKRIIQSKETFKTGTSDYMTGFDNGLILAYKFALERLEGLLEGDNDD